MRRLHLASETTYLVPDNRGLPWIPASIVQILSPKFQIPKLGQFLAKKETDRSGRAMAVFGDYQVGDVLPVRVFIVIVLAIDEDYYICILFDRVVYDKVVSDKIVKHRYGEIVNVFYAIRLN